MWKKKFPQLGCLCTPWVPMLGCAGILPVDRVEGGILPVDRVERGILELLPLPGVANEPLRAAAKACHGPK